MGDAVITSLVTDVVRKLASTAFQELCLLWRVDKDVLALRDDFKKIQSDLDNAEQIHPKDDALESWIRKLRSTSLMAENVLDEVSTEAMLRRLHKELGIKYKLRDFFPSNYNQLMFRFRIAHKVKSVRSKLGAIEAKRSEVNMTPSSITSVDVGIGSVMPNRETSSLIHSSIIYGRNEEIKMVTDKICNEDIVGKLDHEDVLVYAIWGMGGLGKTTLAQLVYNHKRVNEHFELKLWRYVSKNFQVKELIKGIIESIDGTECRLSQLDVLQVCLQEKLNGKRFLVVLDDVWIEADENNEWDKLRSTLRCGAKGSVVMVTTRNKTTSQMMAKVPELQHELVCLSKEDSWLLFEKLAFAEGREGGDRRELEPIGKEIVEKCKGLPLAVKTLGGLMWYKTSTREWEQVMTSNIWELQDDKILPALKLSYDNLLPHIKRCFSYCCLFPKGSEMEKDSLILLWIGNGFIPRRREVDLYVLGEEIYNCLVWRSFFQIVDEKYKMHDLIHDLAQYVMGDDCLIIESDKKVIPEDVLHLSSLSPLDSVFSDKDLKRLRLLRSVLTGYGGSINHVLYLHNLRVLGMVRIRLSTLPESIGKLKYLKYLNLSGSDIESLPNSIIYLQNLQVLILEGCVELLLLPEGMRYMRNLQHLNIIGCYSLQYLPVGIFKEVNDLRLTYFQVDKKNGAKIGELRDLNNHFVTELGIGGLENVEGGLMEAKNANLNSKTNLLVLRLYWTHIVIEESDPEEVLEGLEPNPNLRKLEIFRYNKKNMSPSWIVNLKNLVHIEIGYCYNCENIPPLGKLPCLKSIRLSYMNSLKSFHEEDYNTSKSGDNTATPLFPSLQELYIEFCHNLVSMPSYFPKLNKLFIWYCDSLLSLPDEIQSFNDLNEIVIRDCENLRRRYDNELGGVDWPKISHVPIIKFI